MDSDEGLIAGASSGVFVLESGNWYPYGDGVSFGNVFCLGASGNALCVGGSSAMVGIVGSCVIAVWQPLADISKTMVSETPGEKTPGRAPWGFFKPALEFRFGTTGSYPYAVPVEARIERAAVIYVDGRRVNGAFVITPARLQCGGTGAGSWGECSEDDAAANGKSPADFRAVVLRYPSN